MSYANNDAFRLAHIRPRLAEDHGAWGPLLLTDAEDTLFPGVMDCSSPVKYVAAVAQYTGYEPHATGRSHVGFQLERSLTFLPPK